VTGNERVVNLWDNGASSQISSPNHAVFRKFLDDVHSCAWDTLRTREMRSLPRGGLVTTSAGTTAAHHRSKRPSVVASRDSRLHFTTALLPFPSTIIHLPARIPWHKTMASPRTTSTLIVLPLDSQMKRSRVRRPPNSSSSTTTRRLWKQLSNVTLGA
jgi:hypothetical protein